MIDSGEATMIPGRSPMSRQNRGESPRQAAKRNMMQENFMRALQEEHGDGPGFTPLPEQLKPPAPEVIETEQNQKDSAAAEQLMRELMSQAPPQVKGPEPVTGKAASIPEKITPVKTSNPQQLESLTKNLSERTKVAGDKIRLFLKNVWYYISGSFIWDKGSKPT